MLANEIETRVLALFNDEISLELDQNWNEILLDMDYDLFDAPGDDLFSALKRYEKEFNVNISCIDWHRYFPWENTPGVKRWFTLKRKDVEATRVPLTVRMFAESAKAGKCLYD